MLRSLMHETKDVLIAEFAGGARTSRKAVGEVDTSGLQRRGVAMHIIEGERCLVLVRNAVPQLVQCAQSRRQLGRYDRLPNATDLNCASLASPYLAMELEIRELGAPVLATLLPRPC